MDAPKPGTPEYEAMMNGALYQRLDLTSRAPYTRGEYIRRAVWMLVSATLFRWSPGPMRKFRVWLVNLFGGRVAGNVNLRSSCVIRHPWLLEIGEHSALADNVVVYNLGPVRIGKHTVVSQDAELCAGTHDYRMINLPLVRPTIEIGDGVWVCAGAFVGPGVRVGNNAIVGARAVVMKDVPEGAIVSGNPAVVVKARPRPTGVADPERKAGVETRRGA